MISWKFNFVSSSKDVHNKYVYNRSVYNFFTCFEGSDVGRLSLADWLTGHETVKPFLTQPYF